MLIARIKATLQVFDCMRIVLQEYVVNRHENQLVRQVVDEGDADAFERYDHVRAGSFFVSLVGILVLHVVLGVDHHFLELLLLPMGATLPHRLHLAELHLYDGVSHTLYRPLHPLADIDRWSLRDEHLFGSLAEENDLDLASEPVLLEDGFLATGHFIEIESVPLLVLDPDRDVLLSDVSVVPDEADFAEGAHAKPLICALAGVCASYSCEFEIGVLREIEELVLILVVFYELYGELGLVLDDVVLVRGLLEDHKVCGVFVLRVRGDDDAGDEPEVVGCSGSAPIFFVHYSILRVLLLCDSIL